jgi:hypothetical protein
MASDTVSPIAPSTALASSLICGSIRALTTTDEDDRTLAKVINHPGDEMMKVFRV